MEELAFYLQSSFFKKFNINNGIYTALDKGKVSYPDQWSGKCFDIEDGSFWFKHRNQCIISMIKNFPPNGFIFDVGGGNGCVSAALEGFGYKTVLLEPSFYGVLNASRRKLPRIICGALEDVDFCVDAVGAFGLFDVLEHVEDDRAFIAGLYKNLQREGRIYLTVPAYNFLWSFEDKISGHFRRYNLRNLTRLFIEQGFEVEYATHFFSILPPAIFVKRTIPSLLGMKREGLIVKDHASAVKAQGIRQALLNKIWAFEENKIRNQQPILFGSSCLLTVRKK